MIRDLNVHRTDIPHPSVRRLSVYLRQLEALAARDVATISSQKLANSLSLTGAQVRKDLAYFGQFGRSGIGYEVGPLITRLRRILGTDRVSNALLVGVGNIGKALAAYQGFRPKGFELVALFDTDRKKVGRKVGPLTITAIDRLDEIVREYDIRLGIIAVPAEAAQFVAERLAAAGIRGILNFAPVQVAVPPEVSVRNIDVAAELEQLNFLTGQ
jgi:redox-sensing transcriptional repressor